MLTSGRFSLVRDTAVRVRISDYYSFEENSNRRIEERETDYPDLTYALVPRAQEFVLSAELSEEQLERLRDRVMNSELPDHVVGELNFSGFLKEQYELWRSRCVELIDELESYRQTIV